jgi:hypothetical protein
MSDDDAPEREFDLAHFPADSRNFAAELAQLQDQEMKHMAGLKKIKDEAERAAAIKDYKQVVTMQRFIIMNEVKVAVKVAKQKIKASKGGGKSDGRRAEFITFCTEIVDGLPELPFDEMVKLVGKSVRYKSKLAPGFRPGGNGAGAVEKAAQRAWVHDGDGGGEQVLIVLRGEDGIGRVLMPKGQDTPDLLKEWAPTEVGASSSKLATVPKGGKGKKAPQPRVGKAKARAPVPGEGSDEESLSDSDAEKEKGAQEEEGEGEEEEEPETMEKSGKKSAEPKDKEKAKKTGGKELKTTKKTEVRSTQYLVYLVYLKSYLMYQTRIPSKVTVSGSLVLALVDTTQYRQIRSNTVTSLQQQVPPLAVEEATAAPPATAKRTKRAA